MEPLLTTRTIFSYLIDDWQDEPHFVARSESIEEIHERIVDDWKETFSEFGEVFEAEDFITMDIHLKDGEIVRIAIEKEEERDS